MANSLGEDITDKHVVLSAEYYRGEVPERVFKAKGGFGCVPFTSGTAVVGYTVIDGEHFRAEGYEIERFATDEEIALVEGDQGKER